jgi:hypothetical protein
VQLPPYGDVGYGVLRIRLISLTIIVDIEGYRQLGTLMCNKFSYIKYSTTLYIFSIPTDIYIETD